MNSFYDSEIDLDRDMPGEEVFLKFNNMVDTEEEDMITGHFDVDVDENGPFITQSIDENYAQTRNGQFFTSDEGETDSDFDAYLDAHPDFNAAMNGHPEYI